MVPVYLLTSLLLSATYARAMEPPRRSLRSHHSGKLNVSARPRTVFFYPGDTIEIKCRAKGGYEVEDYPFISFNRLLDNGDGGDRTVIPLSSHYPGVTIEAQAATSHSQKRRGKSVKVISMSPVAWNTLQYGQNLFCCRTSTINGETKLSYFIVNKVKEARRDQ